MWCDALQFESVLGNDIQFAVVGPRIDAPEARAADVGQAGREAIAEVSEQAEHDIAIRAGIGHYPCGLQFGLLFECRAVVKEETGVPGHFCTSSNERDCTRRSGRWRRERSIRLSRS